MMRTLCSPDACSHALLDSDALTDADADTLAAKKPRRALPAAKLPESAGSGGT
jgi:hypothetical protein